MWKFLIFKIMLRGHVACIKRLKYKKRPTNPGGIRAIQDLWDRIRGMAQN